MTTHAINTTLHVKHYLRSTEITSKKLE